MGADHTVQQALSDWRFPTGSLEVGAYIIEQLSSPALSHYDTPGAWAKMVNNIYEAIKPPLINDTPGYNSAINKPGWSTTSGTFVDIARYRVPSEMIGSGTVAASTIEGLNMSWLGSVSGGGTASIKLTTTDDSTTGTFTAGTAAWDDVAKTKFDDSLADEGSPEIVTDAVDPEVVVALKTTAGTAVIDALQIYWWAESTTLPDGPYDNQFEPANTSKYADKAQGVSVPKMRKLLTDLDELKRRRTPGMIISSYLPSEALTVNGGGITDTAFRAIAWRHELVNNARVYIYARAEATTGILTVTLDRAGVAVSVPVTGTSYQWYRADLAFTAERNIAAPIVDELRVKLNAARARGCCAWFRAITTGF